MAHICMRHTWMSHGTHGWVMSHTNIRDMTDSHEWVMSHTNILVTWLIRWHIEKRIVELKTISEKLISQRFREVTGFLQNKKKFRLAWQHRDNPKKIQIFFPLGPGSRRWNGLAVAARPLDRTKVLRNNEDVILHSPVDINMSSTTYVSFTFALVSRDD